MSRILRTAALAAAGISTLLLSGCVVAPAAPAYGYGYGYSPGYYAPAPLVVQPSVGFYGRWGGGGRRYWR